MTTSAIAASSLPSSSERSSSSALNIEAKEGMESDDEVRRLPEMGGAIDSGRRGGSVAGAVQPSSGGSISGEGEVRLIKRTKG
ncbi:hypothetical protein SASPL_153271 [Salvia splendens]|uniref:Uncharacterized protein n=1 Tax=Salvia splendens TaxID=180675 RepID=A0A8X8W597_SALSN|nr:hypothetical protein SASPL_153271 [Salvia splendens]